MTVYIMTVYIMSMLIGAFGAGWLAHKLSAERWQDTVKRWQDTVKRWELVAKRSQDVARQWEDASKRWELVAKGWEDVVKGEWKEVPFIITHIDRLPEMLPTPIVDGMDGTDINLRETK